MAKEASSSSSQSVSSPIDDRSLLKFYQKKYEEFQRKEDKYKEKVNTHLKNLVSDRHELEEEVLRRGEKIADLQKALVELQLSVFEERERFLQVSSENEKLKRKEEQLHENICELLSMTQEQDLKDKIIYIMKNPKVEIGYRTDVPSKSKFTQETSISEKLKKEIDQLKCQLDEALKISRSKSDVLLEDCKQALEKSKAKIKQDDILIKELKKKLHDMKVQQTDESQTTTRKGSQEKTVAASTSISREDPATTRKRSQEKTVAASTSISHEDPATTRKCPQEKTVAASTSVSRENPATTRKRSQEKTVAASTSISREDPATTRNRSQEKTIEAATSISREDPATTRKRLQEKTFEAATSISWENPAKSAVSYEDQPAKLATSDSEVFTKICSHFKDIHLGLILLSKMISKVNNNLNTIQTTKLYQRLADIPNVPSDMPYYVEESTILQLESCVRQSTRLTFDISNMFKILYNYVAHSKKKIPNVSLLKSELKNLEEIVKEMTVIIADSDLINIILTREDFFKALRDSSFVIPDEKRMYHLENFKKFISNGKVLSEIVSKATNLVESLLQKYDAKKRDYYDYVQSLRTISSKSVELLNKGIKDISGTKSDSEIYTLRQAKSQSVKDLQNLQGIYQRAIQEAESLGFGSSAGTKLLTEKLKTTEKKLQEEEELEKYDDNFNEEIMEEELAKCDDNFNEEIMEEEAPITGQTISDFEDALRRIDKTLSKVKLMEQGKYLKDEELCRRLAENVNALMEQFKELTLEFNVKSVQDQFSEYSRVTLSKLEELAKQCRNSVVAAEAQIASHRSNAKHLSENLKETEELLRESIHECLSLKQKLKQVEDKYEMEKSSIISNLKDKIEKTGSHEANDVLDELLLEYQTYKDSKPDPFICFYCRKGPGHKFCEEKIKDLSAECRKFKTQLKLFQKDTSEEKLTLKYYKDVAEKKANDLVEENKVLKDNLESVEKKYASVLEQLKLEKNRLKNMERFRRLEIEGFQTDIKQLKGKIRDLEKQLLKAVLIFENNNKDMELLKTVHETAQRSKEATAALRRLKAKLYELERDIKNL